MSVSMRILLVVLAAALPSAVRAQQRFEIIPAVGAVRYGEGGAIVGSPAVGARLGAGGGMYVSADLRYVPADIEIDGCLVSGGLCGGSERRELVYAVVGFGVERPGAGVRPYGGFSAGALRQGSRTLTTILVQGGVVLPITRRLGADVRYHQSWDDNEVEYIVSHGLSIGAAILWDFE